MGQAVVSSRCNGYDHVVQNFRLYPSVYFIMGNALVVPLITQMGKQLLDIL